MAKAQAEPQADGATPRPWNANGQFVEAPKKASLHVAYCSAPVSFGLSNSYSINDDEARANAALIVKAVNSYDANQRLIAALVEALEAADEWICSSDDAGGSLSILERIGDALRLASAKQEG